MRHARSSCTAMATPSWAAHAGARALDSARPDCGTTDFAGSVYYHIPMIDFAYYMPLRLPCCFLSRSSLWSLVGLRFPCLGKLPLRCKRSGSMHICCRKLIATSARATSNILSKVSSATRTSYCSSSMTTGRGPPHALPHWLGFCLMRNLGVPSNAAQAPPLRIFWRPNASALLGAAWCRSSMAINGPPKTPSSKTRADRALTSCDTFERGAPCHHHKAWSLPPSSSIRRRSATAACLLDPEFLRRCNIEGLPLTQDESNNRIHLDQRLWHSGRFLLSWRKAGSAPSGGTGTSSLALGLLALHWLRCIGIDRPNLIWSSSPREASMATT